MARRAARNYVRCRRAQEGAGNNNEDTGGVAIGQNIGNRKEDLADNESSDSPVNQWPSGSKNVGDQNDSVVAIDVISGS